jgi:hypothetical protein
MFIKNKFDLKFKKKKIGCWWLMPVIPAMQEAEAGESWFKVSLGG